MPVTYTTFSWPWLVDKVLPYAIAAIIGAIFSAISAYIIFRLSEEYKVKRDKIKFHITLFMQLKIVRDEIVLVRNTAINFLRLLLKDNENIPIKKLEPFVVSVIRKFIDEELWFVICYKNKGFELGTHLYKFLHQFIEFWNIHVDEFQQFIRQHDRKDHFAFISLGPIQGALSSHLEHPSRHHNLIKTADFIMNCIDEFVKDNFTNKEHYEFKRGRRKHEECYFEMEPGEEAETLGRMKLVNKELLTPKVIEVFEKQP